MKILASLILVCLSIGCATTSKNKLSDCLDSVYDSTDDADFSLFVCTKGSGK